MAMGIKLSILQRHQDSEDETMQGIRNGSLSRDGLVTWRGTSVTGPAF